MYNDYIKSLKNSTGDEDQSNYSNQPFSEKMSIPTNDIASSSKGKSVSKGLSTIVLTFVGGLTVITPVVSSIPTDVYAEIYDCSATDSSIYYVVEFDEMSEEDVYLRLTNYFTDREIMLYIDKETGQSNYEGCFTDLASGMEYTLETFVKRDLGEKVIDSLKIKTYKKEDYEKIKIDDLMLSPDGENLYFGFDISSYNITNGYLNAYLQDDNGNISYCNEGFITTEWNSISLHNLTSNITEAKLVIEYYIYDDNGTHTRQILYEDKVDLTINMEEPYE